MRDRSLSHIFPVNRFRKDNCLTSYLDIEVDHALRLEKVSSKSLGYVKDILDTYNDGGDLSKITFEAENELEESLENVCKTMISPRSRINERSEASFFNQYLMPFMNEVVLEGTGDDTVYSLIDGSEKKKAKKPDFMLGIKDRKRDVYFFYVELKRPACKSVYQEENDFVKLLKMMKASIDYQITLGIRNPKSFGLLCEDKLDVIHV